MNTNKLSCIFVTKLFLFVACTLLRVDLCVFQVQDTGGDGVEVEKARIVMIERVVVNKSVTTSSACG